MKKTAKKGFTIVELVIVIAVIAILAAVLIPTFVSLVNKANNSADTQMVANINKYLAALNATGEKNDNIVDAMKDAEDAGYNAKALANATNDILWDPVNDCFLAVKPDGESIVAGPNGVKYSKDTQYWIVSNTMNEDYKHQYAVCLAVAAVDSEIEVSNGLYLMATPGTKVTVKVTGNGVDLYGVIYTLNANGKNPTVHGYVYILNGAVTSEGGTFHADQNDNTKVNGTDASVTPAPSLSCYNDGNGECVFCEGKNQFTCQHPNMTTATTVPVSCSQVGVETKSCPDCGYTQVKVIDKLPHELVDVAKVDATCTAPGKEAGKECKNCTYEEGMEVIAALGHDEVNHEAQAVTCEDAGWNAYVTCSRCDYTTYNEIPAKGHTEAVDAAVAPKCLETGKTEGKHCSDCGKVLVKQEEVAATGHGETELRDVKKATCTEAGYTGDTYCKLCNTKTKAGELTTALGHDEVSHEGKTASCTAAGWKPYVTCTRCEYSTYEVISQYVHNSDSYTETTNATCEEDGVVVTYCKFCNKETNRETIKATGHRYSKSALDGYECLNGNCTACRPTTRIDNHIIQGLSLSTEQPEPNKTYFDIGELAQYTTKIVFGFREDYITYITEQAQYGKISSEGYDYVEIYVVKKDKVSTATDSRTYQFELYVLSDYVMCFRNAEKEEGKANLPLISGYGLATSGNEDKTEGAVQEVRFENFNTQNKYYDAPNGYCDLIFGWCYVKDVYFNAGFTETENTYQYNIVCGDKTYESKDETN